MKICSILHQKLQLILGNKKTKTAEKELFEKRKEGMAHS
jgi:hypothetical protein